MLNPDELPAREEALAARVAELEAALARAAAHPGGSEAFLARLAHDLLAPLTGLGGFLELLARGAAGPLDEKQAALLAQARAAFDRLRRVIERTHAFSRLQRGILENDPGPCDLAALAREAAAARGARVRLEIPAEKFPVRADAHLISIALHELLDNALRLGARESAVTLALAREAGLARLTVRGGAPLPSGWRWPERPPETPAPGAGPGLGLPLVKGIAALIGGEVAFAGDADGVEFSFTVPG